LRRQTPQPAVVRYPDAQAASGRPAGRVTGGSQDPPTQSSHADQLLDRSWSGADRHPCPSSSGALANRRMRTRTSVVWRAGLTRPYRLAEPTIDSSGTRGSIYLGLRGSGTSGPAAEPRTEVECVGAGKIRVSCSKDHSLLVLSVLREGELYGYEIAQRVRERAAAPWRRAKDRCIRAAQPRGRRRSPGRVARQRQGPRRRYYRITPKAAACLRSTKPNGPPSR